jgi:hypothetical protein
MEDYFDRLDEVFGASPTPAPKEDGDFAFDPAAAAAPAPQARNERLRDLPAVTEIPRYEEPAWPPPRASEPARPPASAPVPAPPSAPPSVPWAPQQVRAQQPYAAAVTHHAAPPPVVRFDHVSAPARFNTPPAPAPPPAAAPVYTPPAFAPTPAAVAAPPSAQTHSEPAPLADAFEALLALEQAMVSNPLRVSGPSPAPPSADESVVAQVTQRVIAQITDRIVREVVSQQAGSIDRLVRQELDRVRNGS